MEQFVRSSLQFAQVAVDGGFRGAQLGGDLTDGALHIKDARMVQGFHDADLFFHGQPVGGQPGAAGHLGNGVLYSVGQGTDKVLHPDAGGGRLGVGPAEGKQLLRDTAVFAGVKVDAEHPDELAVVLDEHGGGAQPPLGLRSALIARQIILLFIHPLLNEAQCHVGKGRALGASADVVVDDGNNGAVLTGKVVQNYLVVRAQRLPQKRYHYAIRLKSCIHPVHLFCTAGAHEKKFSRVFYCYHIRNDRNLQ